MKKKLSINCNGRLFNFNIPMVMGILNIGEESFFDGGKYSKEDLYLPQAKKIIEQGADILDIGAVSSRPGAKIISSKDEIKLLSAALKTIRKLYPEIIISIDTYNAQTAHFAVDNGANIINDISAGTIDKDMFSTIGKLNIPYILMHIKGVPENMQKDITYTNIINEINIFFSQKINELKHYGAKDIIIDPGIGFGKTVDNNYDILANLEHFDIHHLPILVGVSRKSMITKFLNTSAEQALNATSVLNTLALTKGADILRVHDIKEANEVISLYNKTSKYI